MARLSALGVRNPPRPDDYMQNNAGAIQFTRDAIDWVIELVEKTDDHRKASVETIGDSVARHDEDLRRIDERNPGWVAIAILDLKKTHDRFVDQVVSPHRLRAISAVGESFPLHCCANGKALLATMSPAQQAQVLPSRLARLTEHTITTPAALRKELERIQLDGVAYDREEQTEGVCAVGAAVRVGEQMVAVSVPVPAQRFYGREEGLSRAVLAWVQRVTAWFAEAK